jgi:hypothetical protein
MGTDSEATSGTFEVNCGFHGMICSPKKRFSISHRKIDTDHFNHVKKT